MLKSSGDKDFPRIYLTSTGTPRSGIIGLVNCLRQEPGGNKVRCVFSANPLDLSKVKDPLVAKVLSNDLVMNVIDRKGIMSSYRHSNLNMDSLSTVKTPYAYINVETRGDLSSLKFIEAPSPSLQQQPTSEQSPELCQVFYAPLNFRDIMLATGKLPPEALPGKLATQECILGLEFVGKSRSGKRVMGMVEARGLATHVFADPMFMWELPAEWTMEEAATVPVAYSTVTIQ
jgi:fatty acid synthase